MDGYKECGVIPAGKVQRKCKVTEQSFRFPRGLYVRSVIFFTNRYLCTNETSESDQ